MNKPFQRINSISNAHVGRDFESKTQNFFECHGIKLIPNISISIGINKNKKPHNFDLGNLQEKIIVECKSHKWTESFNVPSAKLTCWNEAMYYFLAAPKNFRKIMFVLRHLNPKKNTTLAKYYFKTYRHLIPEDVELWEFNVETENAQRIYD